MEYVKPLLQVILGFELLEKCIGFPADLTTSGRRGGAGAGVGVGTATQEGALLAAALVAAAVSLLVGCACCGRRKGFRHSETEVKELNNSVLSSQQSVGSRGPSVATSPSEFTIFPPAGVSLTASASVDRSSIVQFEPLPDIRPVAAAAAAAAATPQSIAPPLRKPPVFTNHRLSPEDWFLNAQVDFPRNQLQYLRELGRGWFGRVVEGEAKGIDTGKLVSKVVVKILDEDATCTDQMYFLNEVKPYRDLRHPNVLRLLGRCLETGPFLVLLESCSSGNLKTFLCQNVSSAEALSQQGVTLSMACGVTSGLLHMVENGFVHTDLAARNCLVSADLTVKVGDYGTSIETFKDEYYCAGDMALPIRWCAPETLHCTDTIIETKEVTASANVWSLAVVLWEICEFGSLPYSDCSDEEVIQHVLTSGSKRLPAPSRSGQPHAHNLYRLMQLCWNKAEDRPPLSRISSMLVHLYQHTHSPAHTSANNNNSLDDFERRWEMSKPNTIPSQCDYTPSEMPAVTRRRSLEEVQPSADVISRLKSPSLQNLRGSMDELLATPQLTATLAREAQQAPMNCQASDGADFDSWLRGMDTSTEEDVRFVRNISAAIRDLDDALAQERTSSSSPSQGSSTNHSPSRTSSSVIQGVDFRLGPLTSESQESEHLNPKVESSGSDTEDETWRIRIERGEFTEKVKEKSKSVADLMVLTHIDNSDNSDSDSLQETDVGDTSLKRNNSVRRKRLASGYGSDGNIHGAVLGEELRETIRRLHESWRDESRLEVIADTSLPYTSLTSEEKDHFLGRAASDTSRKRSESSQKEERSVEEAATKGQVSVIVGASEDFTLDYFRGLKTVYAEPEIDDVNSDEASIETWDKFLNNYTPPERDYPSFSQSEPSSPGRGSDDILGSSFETTPAKVILSSEDVAPPFKDSSLYINMYSSNDDSIYGSMKLSDYQYPDPDSTKDIYYVGEKRYKKDLDLEEDDIEDEFCLDPTKNHTPDDERSSDSGFRDKGSLSESCEDACDEKYNLEDVEAELEEAFSKNVLAQNLEETGDPCKRLDVLLSSDAPENTDIETGWFLHPQTNRSEKNDIVNLTLNEEFANAIRNELRDKLANFQQNQETTKQLSDEESNSDSECEESPQKERANIVIQYKTYSAPLSPILEEKESLSSDNCSPYHKDITCSESEPLSPVFVFDENASSVAQVSNFEDDIRKALSECPAEADENWSQVSFDGTSVADDDPDTLPLDSDSLNSESKKAKPNVDLDDYPELDEDDDVLVVNTETNEVTLVENDKVPKIEVAFDSFCENISWKPRDNNASTAMTPDSISPDVLSPVSPVKELVPRDDQETSYGTMEEILPNNEAAEIVADLESCGVISQGESTSPSYSSLPKIESRHGRLSDNDSWESALSAPSVSPVNVEEKVYQPPQLKVIAKRICDAQVKYYAKQRALSDLDTGVQQSLSEQITIEEIEGDENEVDCSEDLADDQLMSTSFMVTENDTDDGDRLYPLDWESDDANSSSSGEFIWKDGEKESSVKVAMAPPESDLQNYDLSTATMEGSMASIVEEDEDGGSSDSGDSESETEFVPSAWNSEATPKRSALRPPHKNQEEKKSVSFKRQRYHCVYEYPREVGENDAITDLMYTDDLFWGGEEGIGPNTTSAEVFSHLYNPGNPENFSCQLWNQNDDEFFISSSARPFHYDVEESRSEFFPGRNSIEQSDVDDEGEDDVDGDVDGSTSDSETEMVTASEQSVVKNGRVESNGSEDSSSEAYRSFPSSEDLGTDSEPPSCEPPKGPQPKTTEEDSPLSPSSPLSPVCLQASLGELRHTRDRLKLDFLLEAPSKKRSVEQVKGEASLLDGEDVNDSGIDSGNGSGIDSGSGRTRALIGDVA